MKKNSINTKQIVNIFIALVLAVAMGGFLSACGNKDSVEETVEITTPSEEAETEQPIYEQAATEGDNDGDEEEAKDEEDSEEEDGSASVNDPQPR